MGRARFLALQGKIEIALGKGVFKKAVYTEFADQLGISYRQFLYYVREFDLGFKPPNRTRIPPAPAERPPAPRKPASPDETDKARATARGDPINARRQQPKRFIFDPTDIDPDRLI